MIVVEIAGQHPTKVSFVHDDEVVEAFAADAPDEAFHERETARGFGAR